MQAVSSSCQSASANQRKFFGLDSEPKSRELSENEIKKLKSLDMVVNQPVLLILDHKIVILTTWLPFFTKSDKLNRFLRWKLPYDRSFTIKIERIQEVQNPRQLYLDMDQCCTHIKNPPIFYTYDVCSRLMYVFPN